MRAHSLSITVHASQTTDPDTQHVEVVSEGLCSSLDTPVTSDPHCNYARTTELYVKHLWQSKVKHTVMAHYVISVG